MVKMNFKNGEAGQEKISVPGSVEVPKLNRSVGESAQELLELSNSEQALFAQSLSLLFETGFLWREEDSDRSSYGFILRKRPLFEDYFSMLGWNLVFHERLNILQIIHRRNAHKKRLSKDTTIWLLIARLLYAEAKEDKKLSLTRNPVCKVSDFVERYAEHFPGKAFRKKQSLTDGLNELQGLRLIRPAGSKYLVHKDPDALVELLPTLEVVVSALKLKDVSGQIDAFAQESKLSSEDVDSEEYQIQ
jgi:hypothetical protein